MALTTLPTAALADGAVTTEKLVANVNFRNLIINGDMSIAQRSTSVASISTVGYYTIDRFKLTDASSGTWTQSQSTDVPTGQGFATSLKMDCTTADASPGSGDSLVLQQLIEGQNLQYLKKGTSSAESTTLSFWVKSNKTGTYICELRDVDNNRTISQSYTISSANTWEKKTITFAGDTTGALGNDNAESLRCNFYLNAGSNYTSGTLQTSWGGRTDANRAVGQVNLADNTANEWYITGVQLEVGTSASDFEFLPYDVNLQRCQRYYQQLNQNGANGWCTFSGVRNGTADVQNIGIPLPTPLRIGNPTITKSSSSLMQAWDGDGYHVTSGGGVGSMTIGSNSGNDTPYLMFNTNGFTGLDTGGSISWSIVLGTPSAEFDAEL
jgi:hypothetical protein